VRALRNCVRGSGGGGGVLCCVSCLLAALTLATHFFHATTPPRAFDRVKDQDAKGLYCANATFKI
jgi:hypothetical protein